MTKTPKTDAVVKCRDTSSQNSSQYRYVYEVSADFARQLELENVALLQAMHEAVISLAYAEARFAGMALRLHPNDPDNDLVLESIGEAVKKLTPFLK